MKLLLLIVLLTCVIEYQLFVGASNCSNCSNGGSNSGRCNNKSCCNKSKCKTSCSNCGERCARLNCNNCGTSNTGCNKKQCDGHETTNNCPTTIRPIITTEVTTVTGKPTNDKVNINIKLSNKIETKNDVNVPIGISLANKNILISTRNESTSGGRNCSTKCPTPPSNDVDIETWTIPPPVLPSVPPRTPEILLTPPPPTGCIRQNPCPLSQSYSTNNNPWVNYISQFPQGQMVSPYYSQSYGNQYPSGQYNLQGFPGHSYYGLQG